MRAFKHYKIFKGVLVFILFIGVCTSCRNKNFSNDDRGSAEIDTLVSLAAKKADPNNILSAVAFVDSAISGRELNAIEKFRIYGFKCDMYHNRVNDTAKARLYADSMMYIIEQNDPEKYKDEYALANYSEGDVLYKQNNFTEAYTYYYKARLIGKTTSTPAH